MPPVKYYDNQFGGIEFRKAFKRDLETWKWKEIDLESFLKLTICEILNGKFVLEFTKKESSYKIASHKEDYLLIKQKYPKDIVLCLDEIINLWRTEQCDLFLKAFMATSILGCTIEEVK